MDLMCGSYGAAKCSPRNWFTFMGDGTNPYVPFQITYITNKTNNIPDAYIPIDPAVIPCNQAINVMRRENSPTPR